MQDLRNAGSGLPVALLIALVAACGSEKAPSGAQRPSRLSTPTATATATATAAPRTTTNKPEIRPPAPTPVPAPRLNRTLSSVIVYTWQWPNESGAGQVTHHYSVPPVPILVSIGAGGHRNLGPPPFDRVGFTFTTAFPTYEFKWVGKGEFRDDARGGVVPIAGDDVLQITFRSAQAHNAAGQVTAPRRGNVAARTLGRVLAYANAGDFEGVVTYGLGVRRPIPHSNPQTPIRVYEVHKVINGQHRYIVAFDVDVTR